MDVQIKVTGISDITVSLNKFQQLLNNSGIAFKIAGDARALIESRTFKGMDVDYVDFPGYSTKPYYRSRKERPIGKGGRRKSKIGNLPLKTIAYDGGYKEFAASTKGHTTPNLFASGDMFRSLQPKSFESGRKARLRFTRTWPMFKAMVNNARRRFLAINEEIELPFLEKNAQKMVNRIIKKSGLE